MKIFDQGGLELDDPVIRHLPEFILADSDATRTVTVRQLLNHTSGIDGDFFPADDPEGPSTRSYLRKMCLLPNLYAPGQGPMTYSNSGFVVAGRIIEVLTGMTWEEAVMDLICKPLGMREAFAHPRQALRFRCAMGHAPDAQRCGNVRLAEDTYLPLSMAACGSVLTMSVGNLMLFAGAHMDDGGCILSSVSARRMREETIPVPPFSRYGVTRWGLGWSIGEGKDYSVVGHDGGTSGQYCYLRVFPEHRIAFALLTNSPSEKLFLELERRLMESLMGTSIASEPATEPFEVEPHRYLGRYRSVGAHYTVTENSDVLHLHYSAPLGPVREYRATLAPYRRDVFVITGSGTPFDGKKVSFLDRDRSPNFLRIGARMARIEIQAILTSRAPG
jgi:CubicO group peptidase (beta-lactamase class C family)